ncbi:MAG TPA: RDD family protein [Solirubrobacteraceae bacterium]
MTTGAIVGQIVPDPGHRAPGPIADPPPGPAAYGGLVTRTIAIVIDALLIDAAALAAVGAVLLLESVFGRWHSHNALAIVAGGVLFAVWVACYFVTFWTTTGQTPGSRVMQIRLARADGGPVGTGRALVRLAGMVLSLPLLWGYLPILWTARRRTAFDLLAGTVVTVVPALLPPSRRVVRHG